MGDDEFLGLRTVIYKVDDLQKAQKWYPDILDKSPYFDESFYVGFNVSGFELGLQPAEGELTKSSNEVAYWGVENIQKSYERLIKLGADPVQKSQSVGGDIKTATMKDPWGNVFGIIYNPNFKVED